MRSFALAAIVILIGTFIANINATVPIPQDRNIELPMRSQFGSAEIDLIESLAKDVSKLPDEISALHSRDNVLANDIDSLRDRIYSLETKPVPVTAAAFDSSELDGKVAATSQQVEKLDGVTTRLLARIEQIERSRPTYSTVGASVSYGSTGTAASYGSDGSVAVASGGSVGSRVVTAAPRSDSAHWTYPGTISGHLQRDHGVSTAGMSREQQLSLHDSLHTSQAASNCYTDPVTGQTVCPMAAATSRTRSIQPARAILNRRR